MSTSETKSQVVGRNVHLERLIRAPPAAVWKAYATRETIEQWFWPQGQGKAKEFDFRTGGDIVMGHANESWTATWRFKELVPEKRIVFEDLWDDGSGHVATGTIEFQRVPEGTKLVVDFGPFPETGPYKLEDAVGGFSVVMDRLAALLEEQGASR